MRGEGSVHADKEKWRYQFRYRGRLHRKGGFATEKAAERALRKALSAIDSGHDVSPNDARATVNDLLDAYLAHSELMGRKTVDKTRNHATPIRDGLGFERAVDITPDIVEAYIRDRLAQPSRRRPGQNLSVARVNRETAVLKAALRHAWKQGKLARVPHVVQLPEENTRGGFVEPGDFETIATLLPEPVADLARFAYLIPWRPTNITALGWEAVDLRSESPTVRLKTSKNGRPVSVPLVDDTLDLLRKRERARQYRTAGGTGLSEIVFHDNGRPVRYREAWDRATTEAGFAGLWFYDLKRSAIRNLVNSGVPIKVAMEISGHKTRAVFDRYHIVSEDEKREALARTFARNRSQTAAKVVPLRRPAVRTRLIRR